VFKYPPQHVRNASTGTISSHPDPTPNGWGTHTSDLSFDKHFIIRNANPTCWQFFGSSSAYALAVEVIVHAQANLGQVTFPETYAAGEYWLNSHRTDGEELPPPPRPTPPQEEVEALVATFLSSTNLLVNFIDAGDVDVEINSYLRYHGSNNKFLTGVEAHQFFRISMVCAVASANKSRHHPSYEVEAMAYYAEALQCVGEVTSDVSAEALQSLLLVILFAMFYPRKGDIWKLLDFACRLSVELNYHCEPNDEFEDEKSRLKRRSIFWGLYTIERTIGQHFGRPSDLTEEIITAEYPAVLNEPTSDPLVFQFVLSSHYCRLTYLRSEIFRELYLPAAAPSLPRTWYEQKLDHILAWRRELHFLDNVVGVGNLTCEVGFDSSICFLFQPLVLRALAATKERMLASDTNELIPRESYQSACKVVDHYNKVFSGAENTPYGQYPITLVSSQYVHQACLTIMAHCLLAIDGRLPVFTFSLELSGNVEGPLDFHGIYEICATCLVLLNTLGQRFPGMVGIFDVFRNLQDKVLPVMIRSGLA
jgi:Fungal specific transcription factor domain